MPLGGMTFFINSFLTFRLWFFIPIWGGVTKTNKKYQTFLRNLLSITQRSTRTKVKGKV